MDWSRFDRGLQACTIHHGLRYARDFLARVSAGEDPVAALRGLTVDHIESFFVQITRGKGDRTRRAFQTVLRRLLRFTNHKGWTDPQLLDAVPSVRTYRLAHVVRGIDDDKIHALLTSLPDSTPAEVRDRAILVMLAVYGVRSGQLGRLRLEHLRWKEKRILFPAHKGGKPVLHVLLPQVAHPLAHYLREVRPDSPYREIFLTCRKPYTPLSPSIMSMRVRICLARAGIETSPTGAHIFRHAFAIRLLRQHCDLKTIADLLGHRDLGSVAIYTKVDELALREVCTEWLEVLE